MPESINHALLDCGASKTVCGTLWMKIYKESLTEDLQQKIKEFPSQSSFMFGEAKPIKSIHKLEIPCTLGGKDVYLSVEVVDANIPLLLSSESMRKLRVKMDFEKDEVTILGAHHTVGITSTGHYVVPLKQISQENVTLLSIPEKIAHMGKKKAADKLHRNFAHAK